LSPGDSSTIKLSLRRTLVLKNSYELLAASYKPLYLLATNSLRLELNKVLNAQVSPRQAGIKDDTTGDATGTKSW